MLGLAARRSCRLAKHMGMWRVGWQHRATVDRGRKGGVNQEARDPALRLSLAWHLQGAVSPLHSALEQEVLKVFSSPGGGAAHLHPTCAGWTPASVQAQYEPEVILES